MDGEGDYDEFGNFIGQQLDSDDDEEIQQQQQATGSAYASTSALPGYEDDDEELEQDGDVTMDDAPGPSSNAIILHVRFSHR